MGHKRIDETRHRSLPPELVAVGMKETDPTNRVLAMLGARATGKALEPFPKRKQLAKLSGRRDSN
jgi:hypothetical protein